MLEILAASEHLLSRDYRILPHRLPPHRSPIMADTLLRAILVAQRCPNRKSLLLRTPKGVGLWSQHYIAYKHAHASLSCPTFRILVVQHRVQSRIFYNPELPQLYTFDPPQPSRTIHFEACRPWQVPAHIWSLCRVYLGSSPSLVHSYQAEDDPTAL